MHFDHERLDVYKTSLKFVVLSTKIIALFPKGNSHLADQLNRASSSIALNVAEGAGEFSKADKARFYRMAKRSATECAACLDIVRELELSEQTLLDQGREHLFNVVSMLIKLIRKLTDS
jgi:four helix bundle protein